MSTTRFDHDLRRREMLKLTVGGCLAAMGAPYLMGEEEEQPKSSNTKPLNLVVLFIDDLGWRDLGCYGSSFYETPNIDRLAQRGVRFTNAYSASPACSPSRAALLTGKHPARLGLTGVLRVDQYAPKNSRVVPPKTIPTLPAGEVTIAEALKRHGYTCASIGKWHLGAKGSTPLDHGFDINIGGTVAGMTKSYFAPYGIGTIRGGPKGEYLTDRLTLEAEGFIDRNRDTPFLLYLSHYAVHTPLQAKPELVKKYADKAKGLPMGKKAPRGVRARQVQNDPVFAAMVQSVDESVGRIVAKLKRTGTLDRTVIVFASDNGCLTSIRGKPTSVLPLREGKGFLYEGGIRVPLIIAGPGIVDPGRACTVPTTTEDLFPTFLEMAGHPPMPKQHLDGTSLAPVFRGAAGVEREAIYWHYPHFVRGAPRKLAPPGGAMRQGAWKLMEFFENGRLELYNLDTDIGETQDLAGREPARAKAMHARLRAWRQAVGARMPICRDKK